MRKTYSFPLGIDELDPAADRLLVYLGMMGGERDDLVPENSFAADWPALDHFIAAVVQVVVVSAIEHHDRARRKLEPASNVEIHGLAIGDHRVPWQMSGVVEQQMKLDGPLCPSELGPVEHLCTQVDRGRVQGELRAPKAKFMARRDGVATLIQASEHVLVQLPRPMRGRIRERGSLAAESTPSCWSRPSALAKPCSISRSDCARPS